ncbi:MAG: LysM peptidoglycan-binding domain-containing protein [Sphingomonadales bacterium]|nr:MAG: LysM peptidoglycan-binding domain-containing protein [Sphingomonadales bacterium]
MARGWLTGLLLLAACSGNDPATWGPPRKAAATAPKPPAARPQPAPPAPDAPPGKLVTVEGQMVKVATGDTLYAISRRTGATVRDLVTANGLEPPYALQAGQTLQVPGARYHIVGRGDTASGIAERYDVSLSQLVRINGLAAPYGVKLGERLRLPTATAPAASPAVSPSSQAATQAGAQTTAQIVLNQAKSPPAAKPAPPKPAPQEQPKPVPPATAQSANPPPPPKALQPAPPAAIAARPGFIWPSDGRILSGFGPKPGGRKNEGVNLAATRGAAVRAAADGVVAYAGDDLPSFGWLVILKHGGGWVTAYGHNEALLVQRGDTVRQGDVIARAGATGSVDRPQLHFQVRQGRRPVDPQTVLPRRSNAS